MKKLALLFFALVLCTPIFAQNSKRTSAYNYWKFNEMEKAKQAIDEVVEHEQTKEDAKSWLYRAQIYYVIDTSKKFNYLSDNPLDISLNSFEKCMELDEKGRYTNEIKPYLINMALQFFNRGIDQYNKAIKEKTEEGYGDALSMFDDYLTCIKLLGDDKKRIEDILRKNNINPNAVLLYAGYSAKMVGDIEKAKEYLSLLVEAAYPDAVAYLNLSNIYYEEGDTAKALDVIEKGKKNVDDSKDLIMRELKIYQESGRTEELVTKLKNAIEKDPSNTNLYLVLGSTYDAMASQAKEKGDDAAAKEYTLKSVDVYKQAIQRNPESFDANYNLGAYYYNEGVELYNSTREIKDYKKVAQVEDRAKEQFRKAVPYLEKAINLNCHDQNTYESLKTVYLRLGENDKFNTLKSKYENCGGLVKYEVICEPAGFDVTYTNSSGNTEQQTISSKNWTISFTGNKGETVYLSAQAKNKNAKITTRIYYQGKIIEKATSTGDFVIAESSGNIPK